MRGTVDTFTAQTVFAHKGQTVNPADMLPFPYALFFVDGDNAAQMAWVKKQDTGTKRKVVLLVNGNIDEAGKTLGQAVYFDQNGAFTKRFRVDEIPARVTLPAKAARSATGFVSVRKNKNPRDRVPCCRAG